MEKEITELFKTLAEHAGSLTTGELKLVKSFQRYFRKHKTLSERQLKTLIEIRKYCLSSSQTEI
ncbi:MAG TPA: hypothetical protein DCX95_01125 [Elusimicrobia bacterium]|nr:hypothetical protein [Elusimicrobiota bacterium]